MKKYFFCGLAVLAFLFFGSVISLYLSSPDVSVLKNVNPETTALIEQRKKEAQQLGKSIKIHQRWVGFRQIPVLLRHSVRISEDAAFYIHDGVDYHELWQAVEYNIEKGAVRRGASTITQQLAKNLYLTTDRSFIRKIREYFIARQLEKNLSKNRIFHIYLNIIEFGPGIFGIASASRQYFYKDVADLSVQEMIRLAAVIPKPLQITPDSENRWLRWRCCWITERLHEYRLIDDSLAVVLKHDFCPN